jgi:hypothetical protein
MRNPIAEEAAKGLDVNAIRLAVAAHIRHNETPYYESLAKGYDRLDTRLAVEERVAWILDYWEGEG